MSKIKAILIDPMDKVIRNVEVEAGLKGYYSMLNCEMIEFAYMEDCPFDVALIVDEEGTFHGTNRGLVQLSNFPNTLFGKVLIVGNMDSKDGYVETDLPEAFYEWFLKNVNVMVFSPEQVVDVLPTND